MLPRTKYARSGDVRIAYQITGEGPFDVVWAPGTMSHLDLDWEIPARALFIERFSKFCRLIRFDKRGTGLSDRPVNMATLEERTDDIRAVMDDVGIKSAHLYGVSEGGSMACLFAATFPERVESLLIWGAQARWIACEDHPWAQTPAEHEEMLGMVQDDWPSIDYIVGPGVGMGKDAPAAAVDAVARYMRAAASPSAVYAYEVMNGQIDTRPILPSIQARTLVMNRTGDPCARVEAARDMASRIPGAKFNEYPGNSHSAMLDDMEAILSDIHEFITGERPIESFDRVLATVLFLDIVSSTERAAELGDTPWRNLLEFLLHHGAKGTGAFPRQGNQHYRRRFSGDFRRTGASGALCARNRARGAANSGSRCAREFTLANVNSWVTTSAASRSTPARASWPRPSRARLSFPARLKISWLVPGSILKISACMN